MPGLLPAGWASSGAAKTEPLELTNNASNVTLAITRHNWLRNLNISYLDNSIETFHLGLLGITHPKYWYLIKKVYQKFISYVTGHPRSLQPLRLLNTRQLPDNPLRTILAAYQR